MRAIEISTTVGLTENFVAGSAGTRGGGFPGRANETGAVVGWATTDESAARARSHG
jgi:hypothetical protein